MRTTSVLMESRVTPEATSIATPVILTSLRRAPAPRWQVTAALLEGRAACGAPRRRAAVPATPRVIASNFITGIKSTTCHIEIILAYERKSLINLAS